MMGYFVKSYGGIKKINYGLLMSQQEGELKHLLDLLPFMNFWLVPWYTTHMVTGKHKKG